MASSSCNDGSVYVDSELEVVGTEISTLPTTLEESLIVCTDSIIQALKSANILLAEAHSLPKKENMAHFQIHSLARAVRRGGLLAISYIEAVHDVAELAAEETLFRQVVEALETGDLTVLNFYLDLIRNGLEVVGKRFKEVQGMWPGSNKGFV